MKPEEVWSPRGAVLGAAAGIAIIGMTLLLTIGMAGNTVLGNYERFVMYVVGAPAGSYLFGNVIPRARLARAAAEGRYDPSTAKMSRRFFLTVCGACIAYAAFVLASIPS